MGKLHSQYPTFIFTVIDDISTLIKPKQDRNGKESYHKKESIEMEKDTLYPAEFAQLYGISKDTLLYYDKIALFRPQVRSENGYRLNSLDQIFL